MAGFKNGALALKKKDIGVNADPGFIHILVDTSNNLYTIDEFGVYRSIAGYDIISSGSDISVVTSGGTKILSLNSTSVVSGTYGTSTSVPQIVVDNKGRILSAYNIPISASGLGTVTSISISSSTLKVINSPITTFGTFGVNLSATGVVSGSILRPFVDSYGRVLSGGLISAADISDRSADGLLASNSDNKIPTEQAVKTYVDLKTEIISLNYLPLSGGTLTGKIILSAVNPINIPSNSYYSFAAGDIINYSGLKGNFPSFSIINPASNTYESGASFILSNSTILPNNKWTMQLASSGLDFWHYSGLSPIKRMGISNTTGKIEAVGYKTFTGTSAQFLKADGSVDSNSYATTSAVENYLPLSGGTMTGTVFLSDMNQPIYYAFSSGGDGVRFVNNGSGRVFRITNNSTGNGMLIANYSTGTSLSIQNSLSGSGPAISTNSNIIASAFNKSGGTSAQFLKADGSVDSTIYVSQESISALQEPTGFVNKNQSMTYNYSTKTFNISAVGGFDFFYRGQKFSKTSDSLTITATGRSFIFYTSAGVLTATYDPWDISSSVQVAYLNQSNDQLIMFGEERHGTVMDWATHKHFHNNFGTLYTQGFEDTFLVNNDNVSISLTDGKISDEDLVHSISHGTSGGYFTQPLATSAQIPVYYYTTAAPGDRWIKVAATNLPYHGASNQVYYSPNNNGVAFVTNNYFVSYYIFATNNIAEPIISIMGQRQDTSIGDAQVNQVPESLTFTDLPSIEMKLLYQIILKTSTTYTGNPFRVQIQQVNDFRNQKTNNISLTSTGAYLPLTGGTLTGLLNGTNISASGNISALNEIYTSTTFRSRLYGNYASVILNSNGSWLGIGSDGSTNNTVKIGSTSGDRNFTGSANLYVTGHLTLNNAFRPNWGTGRNFTMLGGTVSIGQTYSGGDYLIMHNNSYFDGTNNRSISATGYSSEMYIRPEGGFVFNAVANNGVNGIINYPTPRFSVDKDGRGLFVGSVSAGNAAFGTWTNDPSYAWFGHYNQNNVMNGYSGILHRDDGTMVIYSPINKAIYLGINSSAVAQIINTGVVVTGNVSASNQIQATNTFRSLLAGNYSSVILNSNGAWLGIGTDGTSNNTLKIGTTNGDQNWVGVANLTLGGTVSAGNIYNLGNYYVSNYSGGGTPSLITNTGNARFYTLSLIDKNSHTGGGSLLFTDANIGATAGTFFASSGKQNAIQLKGSGDPGYGGLYFGQNNTEYIGVKGSGYLYLGSSTKVQIDSNQIQLFSTGSSTYNSTYDISISSTNGNVGLVAGSNLNTTSIYNTTIAANSQLSLTAHSNLSILCDSNVYINSTSGIIYTQATQNSKNIQNDLISVTATTAATTATNIYALPDDYNVYFLAQGTTTAYRNYRLPTPPSPKHIVLICGDSASGNLLCTIIRPSGRILYNSSGSSILSFQRGGAIPLYYDGTDWYCAVTV